MTSRLCAKQFPNDGGMGTASPLSKMVALGFDDGPTEGIVCCENCSSAYRFETLAIDFDGRYDHPSWDRGEELRVFALTSLPPETFDRIVDWLSSIESPRWPVWAPGVGSPSSELARVIEAEVVPALAGSSGPRLLIAAANLLATIVAIRDFPTEVERP